MVNSWDEAKPFLRSALAFIIHLRYGNALVMPEDLKPKGFDVAYAIADHFITQLEKDVFESVLREELENRGAQLEKDLNA